MRSEERAAATEVAVLAQGAQIDAVHETTRQLHSEKDQDVTVPCAASPGDQALSQPVSCDSSPTNSAEAHNFEVRCARVRSGSGRCRVQYRNQVKGRKLCRSGARS